MSDLIDRDEVIEIIESVCSADDSYWMPDTLEKIRNLSTHPTPSNTLGALDCVDRRLVSYKLTDLINEFEEILSHIREREENDSVCGLCEYDGAYMGQSGDWCNECPGFDKADCFKLKDKYKKEWLELMNTLPSVELELRPISYLDCSNAMLKMWMDNVLTDGEYNRIMDKLNAKHEEDMRGDRQ